MKKPIFWAVTAEEFEALIENKKEGSACRCYSCMHKKQSRHTSSSHLAEEFGYSFNPANRPEKDGFFECVTDHGSIGLWFSVSHDIWFESDDSNIYDPYPGKIYWWKAEVSENILKAMMAKETVEIIIKDEGEDMKHFLTGHAVNWKEVPGGIRIIVTPRRLWHLAGRYADYCRERNPNKLSWAVLTLCEAFQKDRGYYDAWKANIAMAFYDEFVNSNEPQHFGVDKQWLHKICNQAAERFLKMLVPPNKGTGGPFAADVRAMTSMRPSRDPQPEEKLPGEQTLGGSQTVRPGVDTKESEKGEDGKYGDRAMGEFFTFGERYWILPENRYSAEIAIYNGDGNFLCRGQSIKASPRFKPQKA